MYFYRFPSKSFLLSLSVIWIVNLSSSKHSIALGEQNHQLEEDYHVPTKKIMPPLMDPKPTLPEITHQVYLNVDIDGKHLHRIVLGLFGDIAPKAVENFRSLCACDRGNGKLSGKPLCYRDSPFHRIITNFMIQGGDITNGDGTGGESIYTDKDDGTFEDESFEVQFNRRFLLAMANKGVKNTNGSQFFITTVKAQWLSKNVVFGTVLEGEDSVKEIERYGSHGGKTKKKIVIVDSGELHKDEHVMIEEE